MWLASASKDWRTCRNAVARGLVLLSAIASNGAAQDSTLGRRSEWMIGGSVGALGYRNEVWDAMTVGFHAARVRRGELGVDIGIGTLPQALFSGVAAFGGKLDLTVPLVPTPGLILLPTAGLSVLGAAGAGAAGATAGFNLGLAAVFGSGRTGLRLGVTSVWIGESRGGLWNLEVGVVRLPNPFW